MVKQKAKAYNPLNLNIGQVVFVECIADVVYNEHKKRVVETTSCLRKMTVCGTVKKAIGKYVEGSHPGYPFDDYDPPSLKVEKYIWFYECRLQIHTKTFLVLPERIKL